LINTLLGSGGRRKLCVRVYASDQRASAVTSDVVERRISDELTHLFAHVALFKHRHQLYVHAKPCAHDVPLKAVSLSALGDGTLNLDTCIVSTNSGLIGNDSLPRHLYKDIIFYICQTLFSE
jgi:hypothetical protein